MEQKVLVEFNWAHLKYSLDGPELADFVKALAAINLLAESSPGFIWRATDIDSKDPHRKSPLGPEYILNLSIWDSAESLKKYVYDSGHLYYLKRKREWFQAEQYAYVLWWENPNVYPTLEDCIAKKDLLTQRGPTAEAFNFLFL